MDLVLAKRPILRPHCHLIGHQTPPVQLSIEFELDVVSMQELPEVQIEIKVRSIPPRPVGVDPLVIRDKHPTLVQTTLWQGAGGKRQ